MLGIKVKKENAETLRIFLIKDGKLNKEHKIFRSNQFIYFPLTGKIDEKTAKKLKESGAKSVNRNFSSQQKRMGYKELLQRIGKKQSQEMSKGYDLFGDIAVIDVRQDLAKRAAIALMKTNKNIRTVLRKGSAVKGKYRTRKFYHASGKRNFLVQYKENGCTFRFDIRDVFFSTRLAHERKRVNELVKCGENVVVMFAGVGPYAIEIAKTHRDCNVVAMELNKKAHKHMLENIKINGVNNVTPEQGDVREIAKRYKHFADRIIMPLPKESSEFLNEVLLVAKDKCVVHYYTFCKLDCVDNVIENTRVFFKTHGRKFKLLGKREVRPYSSSEIELVIDFLISR